MGKVGPIVAGAMAEQVGWRSFWWLNVGLFGLSFITTVFLFPETKWHRPHPTESEPSLASQNTTAMAAKDTDCGPVTPSDHIEYCKSAELSQTQLSTIDFSETAQKDPYLGHGSPSRQQFSIFPAADPHASLWDEILIPWKLFALPIVEFAGFVVSWSAGCLLVVNLTQSQNFAAPPYNYNSLTIGKHYIHTDEF